MTPLTTPLFLTPQRIRTYALLLLLLAAGLMILSLVTRQNGLIGDGVAYGFDFIAFYTASVMAQSGDLIGAFDGASFYQAIQAQIPGVDSSFYWLYPPTFAFFILPLTYFPYVLSYWLWIISGIGLYLYAMRKLLPSTDLLLPALAFPCVYLSAYHGQNSFLVTGFFALTVAALLQRKDKLAGVWMALLLIKPHFGLLLPLALLLAKRRQAFLSACFFSLFFLTISYLYFGQDYLQAFWQNRSLTTEMLQAVDMAAYLTSPYGFMLSITGSVSSAYIFHALIAVTLGSYSLFWIYREGLTRFSLALLLCASLLITPYCRIYDLLLLAIPVALLIGDEVEELKLDRIGLLFAGLLPLFANPIAQVTGISIGMFPILIVYSIIARKRPLLFLSLDISSNTPQPQDKAAAHGAKQNKPVETTPQAPVST